MTNKELREILEMLPNYLVTIEGAAFCFDVLDDLSIALRTRKYNFRTDAAELRDLLALYPTDSNVRADGCHINHEIKHDSETITLRKQ